MEKPRSTNKNSMNKQPQVFLTHASEDKDAVRRLYAQLKSSGFRPWLDEVDIIPGQNWRVETPRAIDRSGVFIACLSTQSVERLENIRELGLKRLRNESTIKSH